MLTAFIEVVSLVARVWALGCVGFSSCGTLAQLPCGRVGSSQTKDRTCDPCLGRWILNQCTTKEVQYLVIVGANFYLGVGLPWWLR